MLFPTSLVGSYAQPDWIIDRAKLGGRSRSAIYADIAAGRLPQPLKLGGRILWPEGALDAFLRGEAA